MMIWNVRTFQELTTEQLYRILEARVQVFVVEQNCPYAELDFYDQKAIHIWAEENGRLQAYCRIFNSGIKYAETSIGRVLTTENARGKKIGKQLMKYAIEVIENRFQSHKIRISAQTYLHEFYADLGFASTGKEYLEDHIPHIEMLKEK